MNRAWLDVLLVLVALLSGSLFFVRGYHDLYWFNPAVFVIITVVGVASALAGGCLVGWNLTMGQKGRVGALRSLWIGAGVLVALLGLVLGTLAVGLAIGVSNTGYWGQAPDDYSGYHMIMGLQITALQASIVPEIVGGFLVGAGLRMKAQDG